MRDRSMEGQTIILSAGYGQHNSSSQDVEAIAQLERVGKLHQYPARAVVFHHGDPAQSVCMVRKGKLKLSVFSRKGRCLVIRFAVAGDLLGLSAVLNHIDHEFVAQTLEPSILVDIPRDCFQWLFQTSHKVNLFAARSLARDHKEMLRAFARLARSSSIRERMAHLLLTCLEFPRTDSPPMSIRMNWTKGELAAMVDSSRETVTRVLRELETEGVIRQRGSLVVIPDAEKLKRLAS